MVLMFVRKRTKTYEKRLGMAHLKNNYHLVDRHKSVTFVFWCERTFKSAKSFFNTSQGLFRCTMKSLVKGLEDKVDVRSIRIRCHKL